MIKAAPSDDIRVLHLVPALESGGMERAMLRLVQHDTSGIQHAVCALRGGNDDLIAQCRSVVPTWTMCDKGGKTLTRFRMWSELRRVMRSYRPHVLHARSTGVWVDAAAVTFRLKDVRLLLSFHGRTDLKPPRRYRTVLNRWAARRADAVLTVSRDAARMIADEWNVSNRKLTTMPNGVDTECFHPARDDSEIRRLRLNVGLGESDRIAICVANLMPIKAIDGLLHAWRAVSMIHPTAKLVIVGDGPERTMLEALADQLRCRESVRFLGHRQDVAQLLRAADLCVLFSRYESCSNAVLEAMASGVPVIACDVGGNSELITHHRTGWLVPPDQPHRLAETIVSGLLETPARQRMGRAARDRAVNEFGLETWLDRYSRLYCSLAGVPLLSSSEQTEPEAQARALACASGSVGNLREDDGSRAKEGVCAG